MTTSAKVTIGMCVKNAEETIQDAIDSIIAQDFPHNLLMLIVVDGYSCDKTLSIIKARLSEVDFKYKIFFEKQGLCQARQFVVDNAEGKYVIWIDGDMTIPKDFKGNKSSIWNKIQRLELLKEFMT
ncbi:MAG: glycosyltransferase [Dehalococcoidia bacterium]|nr:MAG: glycosyltransferase [Dehalococcoidia bacterium]